VPVELRTVRERFSEKLRATGLGNLVVGSEENSIVARHRLAIDRRAGRRRSALGVRRRCVERRRSYGPQPDAVVGGDLRCARERVLDALADDRGT